MRELVGKLATEACTMRRVQGTDLGQSTRWTHYFWGHLTTEFFSRESHLGGERQGAPGQLDNVSRDGVRVRGVWKVDGVEVHEAKHTGISQGVFLLRSITPEMASHPSPAH